MADPFAVLGLPRAHAVHPADLDRRLRERAKSVHPDRAAPAERLRAAAASAELHAAHRTLKDPLARAEALLALAGEGPPPPPGAEFLEAQLVARERLASGELDPALARDEAAAALAASVSQLGALLVPGAATAALAAAAAELVRARFHASLLRDAVQRIGPGAPRTG